MTASPIEDLQTVTLTVNGSQRSVAVPASRTLLDGLRDVDRHDAGVSVRRAQRVPPQHPRHDQVARVCELALDLRRRVCARDELADLPDLQRARGGCLRHARLAARRTASKIFA